MVKFVNHGALGKMGRTIARLASANQTFKMTSAVDAMAASLPLSEGISGDALFPDIQSVNFKEVDVLIDFSIPEASMSILKVCRDRGIPMVIGTTGFTAEEEAVIRETAKKIPILKSSNMSIGVNLLFALTKIAAQALQNRSFQAEVMEIHHGKKKDAPSGTAKSLEKILLEAMSLDKSVVYGRSGMVGERKADELGIFALRGGDVVGDHTVFFLGEGERLELKHQAVNRDIFARGALDAAAFLKGKIPGMYSMAEVLNIGNS